MPLDAGADLEMLLLCHSDQDLRIEAIIALFLISYIPKKRGWY